MLLPPLVISGLASDFKAGFPNASARQVAWSTRGEVAPQHLPSSSYLFIFLSSSYPSCHLSPSHPSRSPPGVYVHVPPSVTGPVSCQVSSLLALSMSQRSDKSEPGVGLSLPLATEVSFSPSIIHILFNLTRWKWPRSVRTSSDGEANAGGRASSFPRCGGPICLSGETRQLQL